MTAVYIMYSETRCRASLYGMICPGGTCKSSANDSVRPKPDQSGLRSCLRDIYAHAYLQNRSRTMPTRIRSGLLAPQSSKGTYRKRYVHRVFDDNHAFVFPDVVDHVHGDTDSLLPHELVIWLRRENNLKSVSRKILSLHPNSIVHNAN